MQGDDPITKFLFGVANKADYSDIDKMVSDDFTAYVNGHEMGNDDTQSGRKLLTDILHCYDQHIGDSFWQLYEEVDRDEWPW